MQLKIAIFVITAMGLIIPNRSANAFAAEGKKHVIAPIIALIIIPTLSTLVDHSDG